jgi:hypothetical protein
MIRAAFFCFLIILAGCFACYARQDTALSKGSSSRNPSSTQRISIPTLDSVELAQANRQKFLEDSVAMFYLVPDSLREDQFVASILKSKLPDFYQLSSPSSKLKSNVKSGRLRNLRDPLVIFVIIGLLIYVALINLFLSADLKNVIRSFFNKNILSQVDKEGGLINSWAFIALFLLFSLTLGLILYQLTVYYNVYYSISGLQLFISLSLIVGLLFALKFIVLKFIGFVFDANRVVKDYITILNLTYFNIAFVLLCVAICLSLLENEFIPWLKFFTVILIVAIFAWQYLRNSVSIISNIQFHKFYLFVYLCALEICPILILIKALKI